MCMVKQSAGLIVMSFPAQPRFIKLLHQVAPHATQYLRCLLDGATCRFTLTAVYVFSTCAERIGSTSSKVTKLVRLSGTVVVGCAQWDCPGSSDTALGRNHMGES